MSDMMHKTFCDRVQNHHNRRITSEKSEPRSMPYLQAIRPFGGTGFELLTWEENFTLLSVIKYHESWIGSIPLVTSHAGLCCSH